MFIPLIPPSDRSDCHNLSLKCACWSCLQSVVVTCVVYANQTMALFTRFPHEKNTLFL